MLLELVMGNGAKPVTCSWFKPRDEFPKFIKYQGDAYEWVMFEPGTYPHEWKLSFAEIPPFDPAYFNAKEKLEDILGHRAEDSGCVCGAKYSQFQFDHLRYCPLWRRW